MAVSNLSFPRQSPLSTYRSLGNFTLLLTIIFFKVSEVPAAIHAPYAALPGTGVILRGAMSHISTAAEINEPRIMKKAKK